MVTFKDIFLRMLPLKPISVDNKTVFCMETFKVFLLGYFQSAHSQ